jgi:ankyrin repeat protein
MSLKEMNENLMSHFLESGSRYIIHIISISVVAGILESLPWPYQGTYYGVIAIALYTYPQWRPERALHHASESNNIQAAQKALTHNNKINIRSFDRGMTALHLACGYAGEEMISFLLERGANINALLNNRQSPLHWAVASNILEKVKLLVVSGADIDIKDDAGQTPLYLAVSRNYINISQSLIDYGADIKTKDNEGTTLVEIANRKQHKELEIFLQTLMDTHD